MVDDDKTDSCVAGIDRREFIELVTKRGTQGATLLASAVVLDFFLAKPCSAAPSVVQQEAG